MLRSYSYKARDAGAQRRRCVALLAVTLVLASLLALSALPASAVGAQTVPAVTMTVTPLMGGHVKYNEWLPLRVRLDNHGADLVGEVTTDIANSGGSASYSLPIELAAGARKELLLYVQPPSFVQQLRVQLVSDGSVLVQSAPLQVSPQPHNVYAIGVMGPESAGLSVLKATSLSNRGNVLVIPLTLADIPARFEPLRSLDCVVIANTDTSALTPLQAESLETWIQQGGRLVVGGGTGAERTLAGLPAALRPQAVAAPVELSNLAALGDYAGEAIQVAGPFLAAFPEAPLGDARAIVSQNGQALVTRAQRGQGWVAYLALDPGSSPFDAWAGAMSFWRRILEPGSALLVNIPYDVPLHVFRAERMVDALSALPGVQLPSVNWLAALLGLYIILVGPLNYLVLRRMRKLGLAWVTIPVLTLAFSAGGYGLGYGMRGNDLMLNQISIITYPGAASGALVRSYVGLLSPARTGYDLQVRGDALVGMMSRDYGQMGGAMPGYSRLDVLQAGGAELPSEVRNLQVNQWSMQYFQAEVALGATAALQADLAVRGDQLEGVVRNTLDVPVEGVVFISGRRFARLGDLAPGEEREISQGLQSDTQGYLVGALFDRTEVVDPSLSSRRSPLSSYSGSTDDERVLMARQRVLEAYLAPVGEIPVVPGGMLLLGWADLRPVEVDVTRAGRAVRATTLHTGLVVVELPLEAVDGHVVVPAGHMVGRLTGQEGDSGECGYNGRFWMADGRLVAEFQLPPSLVGLQTTALSLSVHSWDASITAVPAVRLYDWAAQTWVGLQGVDRLGKTYPIPSPERFVHADTGLLTMEAELDSEAGACYQFDWSLEGDVP